MEKYTIASHLYVASIQEYITILGLITKKAESNTTTTKECTDPSIIGIFFPIFISVNPSLASLRNNTSTAVELNDMTLVKIDPYAKTKDIEIKTVRRVNLLPNIPTPVGAYSAVSSAEK